MVKRIVLIMIVILSVAFAVNRIDNSKSISSNYLVLATVEEQNMVQIIKAVQFYIPSFTQTGVYVNCSPRITEKGHISAVIDTATDDGYYLKNKELNFNNNYMFPMTLQYSNVDKSLNLDSIERFDETVNFVEYKINKDGEDIEVRMLTMPK